MQTRAHRDIGQPYHDPTVEITHRFAREVAPGRHVPQALFDSPHHGESIIQFEIKGFARGATRLTKPMRAEAGEKPAGHDDGAGLQIMSPDCLPG